MKIFISDHCIQFIDVFNYCFYYVRHSAEMHENRRFFSRGMEFAKHTYAYVLEAPGSS